MTPSQGKSRKTKKPRTFKAWAITDKNGKVFDVTLHKHRVWEIAVKKMGDTFVPCTVTLHKKARKK